MSNIPVAVKGGLLSMGDAHLAQGDGELDGTAIETSITGEVTMRVYFVNSYLKKSRKGGSYYVGLVVSLRASSFVTSGQTRSLETMCVCAFVYRVYCKISSIRGSHEERSFLDEDHCQILTAKTETVQNFGDQGRGYHCREEDKHRDKPSAKPQLSPARK